MKFNSLKLLLLISTPLCFAIDQTQITLITDAALSITGAFTAKASCPPCASTGASCLPCLGGISTTVKSANHLYTTRDGAHDSTRTQGLNIDEIVRNNPNEVASQEIIKNCGNTPPSECFKNAINQTKNSLETVQKSIAETNLKNNKFLNENKDNLNNLSSALDSLSLEKPANSQTLNSVSLNNQSSLTSKTKSLDDDTTIDETESEINSPDGPLEASSSSLNDASLALIETNEAAKQGKKTNFKKFLAHQQTQKNNLTKVTQKNSLEARFYGTDKELSLFDRARRRYLALTNSTEEKKISRVTFLARSEQLRKLKFKQIQLSFQNKKSRSKASIEVKKVKLNSKQKKAIEKAAHSLFD